MRKKIEQKEVNVKEVNAVNTNKEKEGKQTMENTLKTYVRLSKKVKFNYDKEAINDTEKLDYQEALQDTILSILQNKKEVENAEKYMKRSIRNNIKKKYRDDNKIDFTDTNFEQEIFAYPLQEVISAKEAIRKILTAEQLKIITMYGKGYNLEDIGKEIEVNHPMKVKRLLDKALKKVESLKLAFYFDSRFATYNMKENRLDKYNENLKWNEKREVYEKVNHNAESKVLQRNFLCLDQNRSKVKSIKDNYDANMIAVIPEMKVTLWKSNYFTYLPESFEHTVKGNVNYGMPEICRNKEVIQITANNALYAKQNKREVKREKREIFGNNHFTSFDGKMINI